MPKVHLDVPTEIILENNSDDDKETRSVGSQNFLRRERSVDDKQVRSEHIVSERDEEESIEKVLPCKCKLQ